MKKTIYPALVCAVTFLLFSCGDNTDPQQKNKVDSNSTGDTTAKMPIAPTVFVDSAQMIGSFHVDGGDDTVTKASKRFYDFLVDLYKRQAKCTEATSGDTCTEQQHGAPKDCSQNYCGDNDCTRKIMCCHRINEEIFDKLTAKKTLGHAIFSAQQIHNIVDPAVCTSQYIRLRTWRSYYYFGRVDEIAPTGDRRISYYSVALMQGIAKDTKIVSFELYKGQFFDDGGILRKIVPFQVNYEDRAAEFYDVSNDHP